MDVRAAFVTDAQTAELVQPAQRTFNDPAGFAQATAVRSAAAGQLIFNASLTQPVMMGGTAISPVSLNDFWTLSWPAGLTLQRRDSTDQLYELAAVMHLGRRELDA